MEAADLQGLVTPEICSALAALGSSVPADQAIVEIGSFKGQSTYALAERSRAHVWAVDPWDLPGNETGRFGFAAPSTREAFERQTAPLRERITAIQGFSLDVAKDWSGPPIGLLYIDGDHRAKSVRRDFRAWQPHLAPRATVVFDDLDTPRNPGVRVVVEELFEGFEVWADRLAVVRCG